MFIFIYVKIPEAITEYYLVKNRLNITTIYFAPVNLNIYI